MSQSLLTLTKQLRALVTLFLLEIYFILGALLHHFLILQTRVYFSWCFVLALQIGPCKTHHVGTSLLRLEGDREHWVPAPLFVPVLPAHLQEGREQPDSGCAHFFLRVGLMGWVTCTVFLSSTALLLRVLQAKGVLGYYLHFQEDKVAVELLQANQTCWRQ